MRVRLRDNPTEEELATMYVTPHDHRRFGAGHWLRVETSIVLSTWLATDYQLRSGADLSCGNGAILNRTRGLSTRLFGDFAEGYEYHGPIESTLTRLPEVDLFICSETIEHLVDPDAVLKQIATKAEFLLLSTPINEFKPGNAEHIWGWSQGAIKTMLDHAGWEMLTRNDLILEQTYSYQIWACRRRK